MKYQYKIIGLDYMGNQTTFYKMETDAPYNFNVGDEVCFPDGWKKESGGSFNWKVIKVQHYIVDDFIAVYIVKA